jgi:TFIIF, beta subunit HTH domain
LEEIAHLNKRGPYALKWSLKPHYNQSHEDHNQQGSFTDGSISGLNASQVAKAEPEGDDDDNGDYEIVKMEDMAL